MLACINWTIIRLLHGVSFDLAFVGQDAFDDAVCHVVEVGVGLEALGLGAVGDVFPTMREA